jgi:hypothetical protein
MMDKDILLNELHTLRDYMNIYINNNDKMLPKYKEHISAYNTIIISYIEMVELINSKDSNHHIEDIDELYELINDISIMASDYTITYQKYKNILEREDRLNKLLE